MISEQVKRMGEVPRGEFLTPNREVFVYFGSNETPSFGAGVCRVPVSSNNVRHAHSEGDEVIYVISGRMRIEVDGEVFVLNQADGILIKKDQMHQIFNDHPTEPLIHTFTFALPQLGDNIRNGYGQSDNFVVHPPLATQV